MRMYNEEDNKDKEIKYIVDNEKSIVTSVLITSFIGIVFLVIVALVVF